MQAAPAPGLMRTGPVSKGVPASHTVRDSRTFLLRITAALARNLEYHSPRGDSMKLKHLALALSLTWIGCGPLPQPQATAPAATPAATAPAATAAGATASTPTASASADPSATAPGPQISPQGVRFNFKPTGKPAEIFLAGSMNAWNPSNRDYLLKDEDGDGTFSITLKLAAGTYQYKFVVDGTWTKDPYAPGSQDDGFGGQNGKFSVP
jgi:Glycogen recognition site of AMP-activated protein kinase